MLMKKIFSTILVALGLVAGPALAQWNPGKEVVKVIIPFAPGGGADQGMRHLQQYAESRGIRMVPVYKGGAEGLVGTDELSRSPGDGLTLFYGTVATIATHQIANPNYRFKNITLVRTSVMSLVTHVKSGINSYEDFERDMRSSNIKPRVFGIGAPGQTVVINNTIAAANGQTNNKKIIPYKGSQPAIQDLVGGHIDYMMVPLALTKPHIDSGKLRLLAIISDQKRPELSHVPNLKNRYPNWPTSVDGFIISMPGNASAESYKFWSEFIKVYMNDKQALKEWYDDLFEPEDFGAKAAQDRIDAAVKAQSALKKENK